MDPERDPQKKTEASHKDIDPIKRAKDIVESLGEDDYLLSAGLKKVQHIHTRRIVERLIQTTLTFAFWFVVLLRFFPPIPDAIIAALGCSAILTFLPLFFDNLLLHIIWRFFATADELVRERKRLKIYRLLSQISTVPFLILVDRTDILVLPFTLLGILIPVGFIIFLAVLFYPIAMDQRQYLRSISGAILCLGVAFTLRWFPTSGGIIFSSAFVTTGIFLVFYLICWLLALDWQVISYLFRKKPSDSNPL